MLESKGLGEMKRATKNNFSYKIQEQGKFLTRKQAEDQGAYRDPNFGKASGTTVAPPEANQVEPAAATQQAAPVQPEVTADDIRAYDAGLSPEESEAVNNNTHQADNDKAIMDPHGKKTDAIMQSRQPVAPGPVQPAAPEPVQPAATAQPEVPVQPEVSDQPSKMDKFLSGVNKAGEKISNFQDRAKAFSQRTGGQGARGDISKLMKYGMFGQESLDKPAQIENLKQQFIQQGYPEAEAVKMATNTVNQAPVDNQKQLGKKEQFDTLKQMYVNNGYSEADAEKMASNEQSRRGGTQDQTGVQTAPVQTGVQTSVPVETGVQTNTPTKTTDALDQAAFDTVDPDQILELQTLPDEDLEGAVQAVADSNNLDAVALRKYIDAQRQAIYPPNNDE